MSPQLARTFTALLTTLLFFCCGVRSQTPAAKVRAVPEGIAARALPRVTGDIAPSRGSGPFEAKQAQEWRDAALALSAESRYVEAENLYLKVLDEHEHSAGLNSPELAGDLNDLGRVCFAQMKYQQAAAYYERAFQILESAKGKNDASAAAALEALARVFRAAGELPQAEAAVARALSAREGQDPPDTLALARGLILGAEIAASQQKLPLAQQQFERAVQILDSRQGDAGQGRVTPALLPALDGLAPIYYQTMRTTDAEAAWRRALAIRESVYGASTLEVAGALDNLGKFYLDLKKYTESSYCYERALFIRGKLLGDTNSATDETLANLAHVYGAQGRQPEAEPLYRQMLKRRETDTVLSTNTLAAIVAGRGNNTEAENLYKVSIAILDKKGFLNARKPALTEPDLPPELLAETLDQYTALLKKMRKKVDAARIEARAGMLHTAYRGPAGGAVSAANRTKAK